MVDVHAVEGATSEVVTTAQNTVDVWTPILFIDPERGTFLRFLNHVSKGSSSGMPVYQKLKDSADNNLPTNTKLRFEVQVAGMDSWLKVSKQLGEISFYNQNDITTQRNVDNIDGAKIPLLHPETSAESGERDSIDIRDIDRLRVVAKSSAQVDWANSSWYVDSDAVEQFSR